MENTVMEQRLAAATSIPPSQRSPEVAAFIECCRLQEELAEEQRQQQGRHSTRRTKTAAPRQQQALADLKLTRSHFLSPTASLCYRVSVYKHASARLFDAAKSAPVPHGYRGSNISALVDFDFSIDTLLLMAAGDPTVIRAVGVKQSAIVSSLLPVYNSIVDRMQQPAVAARLRQELQQLQADTPRPLLSFEELLAHFVMVAFEQGGLLLSLHEMAHGNPAGPPGAASAVKALATAAELLPRLVPGEMRRELTAILAAQVVSTVTSGPAQESQVLVAVVGRLRQLLERAQQQGRDYIVALCGYQLADFAHCYALVAFTQQHIHAGESSYTPSAFLGWLQQASQAHARCRAVLPKQWMAVLKERQASALAHRPLLERLQRQGNRWQAPTAFEASQADAVTSKQLAELAAPPDVDRKCSQCGAIPPRVLLCGGCRQVRYCSPECQRGHWSQHKAYCKAQQQQQKKKKTKTAEE